MSCRQDSISYCQISSLVNMSHSRAQHPGHDTLLPSSWSRSAPLWRSLYFILAHFVRLITCFQDNGLPSFRELDIATRLKIFRGAYIWEVKESYHSAHLNILYVILIGSRAFTLINLSGSVFDSDGTAAVEVRDFKTQNWRTQTNLDSLWPDCRQNTFLACPKMIPIHAYV